MLRLTLAALLVASTAYAHDEPEQKTMVINGGLICDTLEQVKEALKNMRKPVDGCGILRGVFPATVTFLPDHVHGERKFHMAQYEFLAPTPWGVQIQYGFFGPPEKVAKEHNI